MRMRRVVPLCMAVLSLASIGARGQSIRSLVNGGNSMYKDQKYTDAEVNYRKALEKEQTLVQGHFNLGDALSKQGKFDEAVKAYENALHRAESKDTKSYAYYNIGNTRAMEQKYQDAVQAYIDALKLKPDDQDTKYNLSYVLEKLRQQQQQQKQQQNQNNKDNKNKNKDKKQDQQNQDQKNQQDQQKQNDQNPDQQQQNQQKQQGAPQEKKMSKADAERILDVLKNNEKEVQKKLRVRQAARAKTDKDW